MLLWDTTAASHQQHIHRGAPLPELTIPPAGGICRGSRRTMSPGLLSSRRGRSSSSRRVVDSEIPVELQQQRQQQPVLSTSTSSRPFTTCYNTYKTMRSHSGGSRHTSPMRRADDDFHEPERHHLHDGQHRIATPPAGRNPTSPRRRSPPIGPSGSPLRQEHHHDHRQHNGILRFSDRHRSSPTINRTRIVEDRSVSGDLLTAAKHFRDIFLPSVGKKAMHVMSQFHQSLHLGDADREVLLNCMHRCQRFMGEVEALLRTTVEAGAPMDRGVVHFSYLRWGEAHELCRGVKKVLLHKHSGVVMYFPDGGGGGEGSAVVVPSVVKHMGGVSPARAVMLRSGGGGGRHGAGHATPTSFRRLCAHALPTFDSIAARWSPRRAHTQSHRGLLHPSHSVDARGGGGGDEDSGGWRSAIDELRDRELHESEKDLLQHLVALPMSGSPDDLVFVSHAAAIHTCMKLLHRIRALLTELHRNGGAAGSNQGTTTVAEEDDAAFLMWLTTVPPHLLVKIEAILVSTSEA